MSQKVHYSSNNLSSLCKCKGNISVSNAIYKVTCRKCLLKIFPYTFVYSFDKDKEVYNLNVLDTDKTIGTVTVVPSRGGFATFLMELWIDPKYRRKGLATIIVRYIQCLEKPPIQLKAESYIAKEGEEKDSNFTQEQLENFYKRLDFVPIANSNKQMIWYPNEIEKKQHTIYVENRTTHFIAFLKDQVSLNEKAPIYNEALGGLVKKYSKLLNIQIVRLN